MAGRLTAQNIIEVGKRLIQAKSLVNHGQWQDWLQLNFQLSKSTAYNFMQCAEKFGNFQMSGKLKPYQMIALLSLPDAAETEKFIAEKAAEGKKVADMTKRRSKSLSPKSNSVNYSPLYLKTRAVDQKKLSTRLSIVLIKSQNQTR